MRFLCVILLFVSAKCFAQYPFEKFPAIKYKIVAFKIVRTSDSTEIGVANYQNYKIKLTEDDIESGSHIWLYYKNKLIKKVQGVFYINYAALSDTIKMYIADINGDGLLDFKITYYNASGAGLGSSYLANIYFFNSGNHHFSAISFGDFRPDPNQEYDFNNDGNYEILGMNLVDYKGHNYWLYDLYNYKNGKLINVSRKYGYPIAIQYLERDNYKVTHRISKKELEKLSYKLPEYYSSN